jgi:rRNA maturation endonuclease Nob1
MRTVEEIKAAIPALTLEERAEVARFLHGWEDDEWDQKIRKDLAEGKLARVLSKVDADVASGKLSELP